MGAIFSFRGRTNRFGYMLVGVGQMVFLMVGLVLFLQSGGPPSARPNPAVGLIFLLMLLAFAWAGMAVTVRRLRDMGWPIFAGLLVVLFVPMGSALLLFWPGKPDWEGKAEVFSDDPRPVKPAKSGGDWISRALEQASKSPASQPEPVLPVPSAPRLSGAVAAASGPRTEFGLRR